MMWDWRIFRQLQFNNVIMKTKCNGSRPGRGFSLVELLVAITIILVLAALCFVGFKKARSSANRAVSIRNIAQLQFANTTYTTDHSGDYLKVYDFDDKGSSYVAWCDNSEFLTILKGDSAFLPNGDVDKTHPPSALDPAAYRSKAKWYDRFAASYGYAYEGALGRSSAWGSPNAESLYKLHQVRQPARTAAFITATDWIAKYSGRFKWQGSAAVEGYENGKIAYRYGGKALVVYFDGHVGEVTREDMKRFDKLGGIKNVFWNANAD
jgi:prepilin-type N-terminal cleavage/methylation domain-containing protein/prepilin-type processing-associated H-X9-DG protein